MMICDRTERGEIMTLDEIKAIDREYLTPAQVASVIGCDPQAIRVWARQRPQELGFPVICVGSRVKIPKWGFIRHMTGQQM